ncbi:hypothetical protein ADIMK_3472 [Marinobacterium lacunae]|uniref:Uncharacterized protein n=1 Tax=Marinobacterium lacunae TaxID=1232683 RepID=A0A081FUX7_9GAMM|nr:hypothetical protein ADIMK_3472 [Marinobacterium lacunae]
MYAGQSVYAAERIGEITPLRSIIEDLSRFRIALMRTYFSEIMVPASYYGQ